MSAAGNSSGLGRSSTAAQFRKLDALPAELRAALAASPYDWQVDSFAKIYRAYSAKRALLDLEEANAEHVKVASFALYGPDHPQAAKHVAAHTLKAWGYGRSRRA